MQEYRAYLVGIDGHIVGYEPIVCADAAEAIAKAHGMIGEHAVELWSGPRLGLTKQQITRPDFVISVSGDTECNFTA